jgi:hypothetical protein
VLAVPQQRHLQQRNRGQYDPDQRAFGLVNGDQVGHGLRGDIWRDQPKRDH